MPNHMHIKCTQKRKQRIIINLRLLHAAAYKPIQNARLRSASLDYRVRGLPAQAADRPAQAADRSWGAHAAQYGRESLLRKNKKDKVYPTSAAAIAT